MANIKSRQTDRPTHTTQASVHTDQAVLHVRHKLVAAPERKLKSTRSSWWRRYVVATLTKPRSTLFIRKTSAI